VNRAAVIATALAIAGCNSGSATPAPSAKPSPAAPPAASPSPATPPGAAPPGSFVPAPPAPALTPAQIAGLDGKALYLALCKQCHGADARGYAADHAPSLVNPTFLESASDEFLSNSIAFGRPGTSMAAYGRGAGGPLGDREIAALVGWLRAQGPAAKPLPAIAGGDPKQGEPIYVASCQKCHGTPTVRGDAVHLANARFLATATDSFVRWAIVHGRPGTPMEAWQPRLTDKQVDDLVAYVRTLGSAHMEGQLPPPTGKEPLVLNPHGKDPEFKLRADPGQDPRYVSAEQVKRALEEKRKLILIDARPQSDWMRVHITGAVSIPYMDMKRLDEMPKDGTWAITYCACPHHLSGIVLDELRRRGFTHSAVLDEGILEWHRRGYPVVAAPGVEPPPKQAGR
jgi:mono/diheme cytochrome c family protein/rhodanese-related sulfurtransferase